MCRNIKALYTFLLKESSLCCAVPNATYIYVLFKNSSAPEGCNFFFDSGGKWIVATSTLSLCWQYIVVLSCSCFHFSSSSAAIFIVNVSSWMLRWQCPSLIFQVIFFIISFMYKKNRRHHSQQSQQKACSGCFIVRATQIQGRLMPFLCCKSWILQSNRAQWTISTLIWSTNVSGGIRDVYKAKYSYCNMNSCRKCRWTFAIIFFF